jgi:hypothetical protein
MSESPRRRSTSFHDEASSVDPPLPDLAAMAAATESTTTSSTDGSEDEPDFETLIRSRSRSKSIHDNDEEISNKIVAAATQPKDPSKAEHRPEPIELAGPIHSREALALQKVPKATLLHQTC